MRPGSNKRMRGRNRRGPNPLARSYESNGPDVKVRGTAQHIADRYLQLARDAQSSGDPVTAESYFQHAEHYLRIVAAAQEQMQAQFGYQQRPDSMTDDDGEGEEGESEGFNAPHLGMPQNGGFNGQPRQGSRFNPGGGAPEGDEPQPPMFSQPRERFDSRPQRFEQRDNWNRQNRNDGNRQNNFRQDGYRQDNHRRDAYRRDGNGEGPSSPDLQGEGRQQPRGGQGESGGQRGLERQRVQGQPGGDREHDRPRRERLERSPRADAPEEQALPSFITAPVRPAAAAPAEPASVDTVEAGAGAKSEDVSSTPEAAPAARPKRGRPRRTPDPNTKAEEGAEAATDDAGTLVSK
jgi:hypothetical protein